MIYILLVIFHLGNFHLLFQNANVGRWIKQTPKIMWRSVIFSRRSSPRSTKIYLLSVSKSFSENRPSRTKAKIFLFIFLPWNLQLLDRKRTFSSAFCQKIQRRKEWNKHVWRWISQSMKTQGLKWFPSASAMMIVIKHEAPSEEHMVWNDSFQFTYFETWMMCCVYEERAKLKQKQHCEMNLASIQTHKTEKNAKFNTWKFQFLLLYLSYLITVIINIFCTFYSLTLPSYRESKDAGRHRNAQCKGIMTSN